jgi:hypothetical protein
MSSERPSVELGHVACKRWRRRGAWAVPAAAARRKSSDPNMALPFGETPGAREPRTLAILAKTIYRELRSSGYETRDVIALAGELLAQVTSEVRGRSATGTRRPTK